MEVLLVDFLVELLQEKVAAGLRQAFLGVLILFVKGLLKRVPILFVKGLFKGFLSFFKAFFKRFLSFLLRPFCLKGDSYPSFKENDRENGIRFWNP